MTCAPTEHAKRSIRHSAPPETDMEPAWCRVCGALWVQGPFGMPWSWMHPFADRDAPTVANTVHEVYDEPQDEVPMHHEDTAQLQTFIEDHGILHFTAPELLRMRRLKQTVPVPDEPWWPRIIPALRLAEKIRAKVGHGLVVGNGYRPEPYNSRAGGTKRSQHIYFRALDLDLPKDYRSREEQEAFYAATCEVFLEFGDEYKMGLGLYRPWRGTRVHIDAGHKKRYWKRKYVKPLLESMR